VAVTDPAVAEPAVAAPAVPDTGRAPVAVFVAERGNGFMTDIARWIVEAAGSTGRPAALVTDRLPQADGSINLVVAPHEFFELFDADATSLQRAAAASVCVCTEQPGTPWFHLAVDACRRGLLTLDISEHGVDALRAIGLEAHRLRLGAVPSMTSPDGASRWGARPTHLLFMGGHDPRRGRMLAELAPRLFRRSSELRLFRFDRPIGPATPGVVFGDEKYALLAGATLLLNLHRDRSAHFPPGAEPPPFFEWARLLEAMANGCVVVTEPSVGYEPLVAGEHFVEAQPHELGDVIDELLSSPDAMASIARSAFETVTGELALERALAPVLDHIESRVVPRLADHVERRRPAAGTWRLGASRVPPPRRLGEFRPYRDVLRTAKRLVMAESDALRRLDATACLLDHGRHQWIEEHATPAYGAASPDVTVLVTVYNYADVVAETLDSILASEGVVPEIVVVEDHATDDSRAVLLQYLQDHPDAPILLLAKDANEGLAAARNMGFERARSPFVMVMDADNHVYPTCLRRLVETLELDPTAAAAYAILEDFGARRDVRSEIAWDVARLCTANYIDAQAMWRRSAWEELGGYRNDDDHVYGWEDWDLWLRLAAHGGHATLRPEILGRYRVQASSMISVTNLYTDDALTAIRERYPALPWPGRPS
jgi:hypothetical protein